MSTLDLITPILPLTVGFNLLNSNNTVIGTVYPSQSRSPVITNDTRQAIKRILTGVKFDVADTANINPLKDRLRPFLIVDGIQYPIGVFLFVDYPKFRHSFGIDSMASLVDQGLILDQDMRTSFAVAQGANLSIAISMLLDRYSLFDRSIEASTFIGGQGALFWPAGTKGTKVVNDIAALCGFLPVYWDNNGKAILRSVPNPNVTTPAFIHTNVQQDSIMEADVPLDVPNRYTVIDSGVTDSVITATYTVPDSAPHSFANRGWFVDKVITAQGLGTTAVALNLAKQNADTDIQGFQQYAFNTPIDPRHDTFDVVRLLNVNYLERRWSWTMNQNNAMTHDLVRVYR